MCKTVSVVLTLLFVCQQKFTVLAAVFMMKVFVISSIYILIQLLNMSTKDLISAEKFRTKTGHIGTDESGFQFYRFCVFLRFFFCNSCIPCGKIIL